MNFKQKVSLKDKNTFGVCSNAAYYADIYSLDQLRSCLRDPIFKNHKNLILGQGSNILLTQDIKGVVLRMCLKGKQIVFQDQEKVHIEVSAGENWNEFVLFCISNNYGGLENLSLIPGNVGTAPMQNIGAYGVEIKESFLSLKAIDRKTAQERIFTREQCQFGYRDSIFKNEYKDRYVIVSVIFELTKTNHVLRISYGEIRDHLAMLNIDNPTIEDVSAAVIRIRKSKLPDPLQVGNAGSFFKNPVVSRSKFEELKTLFPDIKSYWLSENNIKIPAGWIIEKAGWRGKRFGNVGVHKKQALVLVNFGNGSGEDIWNLSNRIILDIQDKFGILLDREIKVI